MIHPTKNPKRTRVLIVGLMLLAITYSSFAQKSAPKPSVSSPPAVPTQEPSAEDVVRITANLVQIDAVVTDNKGQQVADLTDRDFEILEDGRPQKITNLSYVSIKSPVTDSSTTVTPKDRSLVPSVILRPEAVHRTIALVVDDLGLSFESTVYVRKALKKFVDEQMQPGDLVAIIRTRAGTGALQQFTADKRQLYAAIDRIRWNPSGTGLLGAFAPIDLDPLTKLKARAVATMPVGAASLGGFERSSPTERLEQFRKDVFAVGTLGALKFVVQGMRSMPGRKAVIFMSDGISIFKFFQDPGTLSERQSYDSGANRVFDSLRQLTDFANRSSVVIYTMDARGLQALGLGAQENTDDQSSDRVRTGLANRYVDFVSSREGLDYLSKQTGGFLIHDNNDLATGIERVLDDQKGYYLIGYRPAESTFNAEGQRGFHNLTVRVKRPGLKVRARTGFYGITDEDTRAVTKTGEQKIAEALTSPFSSADVHVRLTSLFGSNERNQPVMRALLYIDGKDLTFTEVADGWHQVSFEVLAVTFGDSGAAGEKFGRTETMRVRDDAYRQAQEQGLIYTVNLPLRSSGAYQLRIAVRDAESNRVGSASQFVEVPNLKKGDLGLSGIVVAGLASVSTLASPTSTSDSVTNGTSKDLNSQREAQANPAVRQMRPGMMLNYAYSIYNARRDKRSHRPQLQTQVRLFQGTQLIYTGKVVNLNVEEQSSSQPISAVGTFQLGTNDKPGDYFLQVIVTDLLADKKHNTTVSWIDFEIVE